jgi:hypothetical protein
MKKMLLLSVIICLAYACKKDSMNSKPQISFKAYSIPFIDTTTQSFNIDFDVSDADGDIEDSIHLLNFVDSKPAPLDDEWVARKMPVIGANKGNNVKAIVSVRYESTDFNFGVNEFATPDSFHMKAFIVDAAGNHSDTITTPKIPWYKKKP